VGEPSDQNPLSTGPGLRPNHIPPTGASTPSAIRDTGVCRVARTLQVLGLLIDMTVPLVGDKVRPSEAYQSAGSIHVQYTHLYLCQNDVINFIVVSQRIQNTISGCVAFGKKILFT